MSFYATIEEVRATGVTVAQASDADLELLIEDASRDVDFYTGQFFEPRAYAARFSGHSHSTLNVDVPVIELTEVAVRSSREIPGDTFNAFDLSDVIVYNRDGRIGQVATMDRDAPRLRLLIDSIWTIGFGGLLVWPLGNQNIQLTGTWGYTEARSAYVDTGLETFALAVDDDLILRVDGEADDQVAVFVAGTFPDFATVTADQLAAALSGLVMGLTSTGRFVTGGRVARLQSDSRSFSSRVEIIGGLASPKLGLDVATEFSWPFGDTPRQIRRITVRMVRWDLGLGNPGAPDPNDPGVVKRHRTRSQEVDFSVGSTSGSQHLQRGNITGDPTTDQILARYRRRPQVSVPQSRSRVGPFL